VGKLTALPQISSLDLGGSTFKRREWREKKKGCRKGGEREKKG